jgi:hypothetical protein
LSSFESITDTTDGLIAVNKQFIDTIGKSAAVLSLFNVVSKKYAVESADLVEVVRKAGGTFSATGGKLEELLAVFTTVRDTTRESAETIAVGLRTIFTRLQRPKTIEYLQQFGIELVNLEGQFVGNFEAIQRIQRGLDAFGVRPGSIKFAEVVEEIGGVLQQSRVIPLLTQGAKLQQVYADAQSASSETAMDLAKAQDTLSFKIAQTQQNFSKLIGDIASSKGFDTLVRGVLSMTNAMIHFAAAIKDVLPLISALLAFNLAKSVGKLALGGPKAFLGKGFATGGFVPGSGSGDTVPAMLTPGEFVVRKSAAQAMGAEALHGINKYADGGLVSIRDLKNKDGGTKISKYQQGNPRVHDSDSVRSPFNRVTISGKFNPDSKEFDQSGGPQLNWRRIADAGKNNSRASGNGFLGKTASAFEREIGAATRMRVTSKSRKDSSFPVDLERRGELAEVRFRQSSTDYETYLSKILRAKMEIGDSSLSQFTELEKDRATLDRYTVYETDPNTKKEFLKYTGHLGGILKKKKKKFASGGSVGTDTVPSLLTPGEFVVNKKSAQAFGYGNLQKVNKYATGGVVGVQRFASGGPVGGAGAILPGLEGLGDLAIVVNQLIPAMASATASFAKISIAASITSSGFSGIFNAGKGVSDFFTAYKDETKRLSEVRDAEIKGYQDAVAAQAKTTAELATARADLSSNQATLVKAGNRQQGTRIAYPQQEEIDDITQAEKAARSSISRGITTKAPVLNASQTTEATDKLNDAISRITAQYGLGSIQLTKAKEIQDSLTSNLKDQSDAVVKYTDLVIEGSVKERALVKALEERAEAENKAANEASAKINTGGIRERIGAGFRGLAEKGDAGDARRAKVQAGIEKAQMAITMVSAYFASSARTAAQALDKLTNAAIESGDAQAAYNNSIAASEKEAQAAGVETGTSGGGAIGGAIGLIAGGITAFFFPPLLPLVPLFVSLGSALGSAIGAALGFFGTLTDITDWWGITDPAARQMEVERKASAAQKSANIKDVEKTTNDSITKSNSLRQFSPNSANNELVKGFDKFKNSSSAQQLGNPATQEQSKQFYDQLASAFEQLRTLPQNAGKGFDQLKRENFGLVSALERSSAGLADHDQVLQGLRTNTDAVSTAVTRERQAKLAAINLQLRQVAIQKQVNTTLANMDSAIRSQTEGLMKFGIALGEDYSPQDIGVDLTDLSSRNTANPEYAAGLNAVYSMGGQSAEQAATLGRAIPLLNNLENSLINQGSEEIRQSFQAAGVSPQTSQDIFNAIEKARKAATPDEPFDPVAVKQEVMGILQPFADNSEDKRKAINTQLQNQLSLVKKQSELQKKQLEYRLAGLDAEREIADTIERVRGEEADPRAARAARLKRTGTILQGTELRGANLAGDKTDIDKISAALVKAELRKQEIVDERKTANTTKTEKLDQEMVGLIEETELLGQAMSSLADVSKENAAIEAKIAKNQEKRAVVREAASNLAFGSNQDRKDFFRTLNQARGVAAFGTADVLRDKDKGNVFSFLKQMKDIPAFGGKTGQEVIDATTRNFLRRGGVSQQKVEEIMAKMIPSEEQALELMKENVDIDKVRNDKLGEIVDLLSNNLAAFRLMGIVNRPQAVAAKPKIGLATGGPVSVGPQFAPKGSDTVPAMLTPGEFVVKASQARKYSGVLSAINNGNTAYLANGGFAPGSREAEAEKRAAEKALQRGKTGNQSDASTQAIYDRDMQAIIAIQGRPVKEQQIEISATSPEKSEPSPTHDQQKLSADIISQGMRAKNERADRDAAFDRKWQSGLGENATAEDHADRRNDYLLNKIQRAKDTMRDGVYAERTANEANDQKRFDKQLNSVAEMGTASSSVDVSSNIRTTIGNFGANSAENKASVAPLVGYDGRLATDYGYSGMSQEQKEVFRKKVAAQRDALTSGATRTGVDKRFGADSILTYGVTEEGIKSGLSGASGYGNKLGLDSYEQQSANYGWYEMEKMAQKKNERDPTSRDFIAAGMTEDHKNSLKQRQLDREAKRTPEQKSRIDSAKASTEARKSEMAQISSGNLSASEKKAARQEVDKFYKNAADAARLKRMEEIDPKRAGRKRVDNLLAKFGREEGAINSGSSFSERKAERRDRAIESRNQKKIENRKYASTRSDNRTRRDNTSQPVVKDNFENAKIDRAYQRKLNKEAAREYWKSQRTRLRGYSVGGDTNTPMRAGSIDTIPALLAPNEFVMSPPAVQKYGLKMMHAINAKRFSQGGSSTGQFSSGANNAPQSLDFSALMTAMKGFTSEFSSSVASLREMPKEFKIDLSSQGLNVNLNSAEFLAKLPDILKTTILEQIQSQLGSITNQVKQSLSTGT